jgi:hypothetical protein
MVFLGHQDHDLFFLLGQQTDTSFLRQHLPQFSFQLLRLQMARDLGPHKEMIVGFIDKLAVTDNIKAMVKYYLGNSKDQTLPVRAMDQQRVNGHA